MVRRFCVAIPLVGRKRHSLGAGIFNEATTTSGVKVAQHLQGLTLTPARGGGARSANALSDSVSVET
jgi:hypothetical protein